MFGGSWWRSDTGGNGHAAADERPEPGKVPGRIGVALGGGAARGWAHIGVLRALDEAGLKPDIIAGTSIGAVVGGCYLAGILDELEGFARGLTRRRVFGLLDLNFGGSGLISGKKLTKLLEAQLSGTRVEDLPQRLVCVATELRTGHEIWLSHGNLIEAMRASYALPGVFQPVRVNGRWLVDGALVNPVPVSVCRALGADVVIAVNLNAETFGRGTVIQDHSGDQIAERALEAVADEVDANAKQVLRRQLIGGNNGPPGISTVMVEAFNIIQDRIARSRLAGDPPDVMVIPRLGKVGLFDFQRAAESIDGGYETCRKMAGDILNTVAALT